MSNKSIEEELTEIILLAEGELTELATLLGMIPQMVAEDSSPEGQRVLN